MDDEESGDRQGSCSDATTSSKRHHSSGVPSQGQGRRGLSLGQQMAKGGGVENVLRVMRLGYKMLECAPDVGSEADGEGADAEMGDGSTLQS